MADIEKQHQGLHALVDTIGGLMQELNANDRFENFDQRIDMITSYTTIF